MREGGSELREARLNRSQAELQVCLVCVCGKLSLENFQAEKKCRCIAMGIVEGFVGFVV